MELEKFCFCCKLQKGALIWSIFSIIFHFIVLITTVSSGLFDEKTSSENVAHHSRDSFETFRISLYWAFLVSSCIHLLASVLLCIGVRKRNHYMMLPWIIVNGIYLIPVAFVGLIGILAAVPILGPIYIFWCICMYYLKIQDDRTLFFQLVFEAN